MNGLALSVALRRQLPYRERHWRAIKSTMPKLSLVRERWHGVSSDGEGKDA